MYSNNRLNAIMNFLAEAGIAITLESRYINTGVEQREEKLVWNFNSLAKSDMLVTIKDDETITVHARYNVNTDIKIDDNLEDNIHELLVFFRDHIMYYPSKDFCNYRWFELMKSAGVV